MRDVVAVGGDRVTRVVAGGVLYFVLVFAAGWLIGPIRVLWLEPRVGETAAVAVEAPLMLAAMVSAARFVTGRTGAPDGAVARAAIGLVGFALLMAAEVFLSRVLRGASLHQWLAQFATVPGAIALTLFLLFAAMPALVGHRGGGA